jgi:glycosyltransferase involved in cell wall biosynthesis
MRIAQIAPLAEAVPPKLYGGTERVVAWLTEELLALGHDVTLFASGDSITRATLVPIIPRALRLERPRPEPFPAYAALLDALMKAAPNFDIVHCDTDWLHLPLLTHLGVPHLTTIHNRLDTPDLPPVISRFPDAPLISISDHHRIPLPSANWLGTVYHGLPAASLQPSYERGKYLAFLGRLTQEKGPEAAIRLARATGHPLRMAAKIPRQETRYLKSGFSR